MNQSLQLVFQYFFAVGAGVGLGLVVTVGGSYVLYQRLRKGGFKWRKSSK